MREIKIPLGIIKSWVGNPIGRCLSIPVKVDWEELQLTEEQVLANSMALAYDKPIPYSDKSMFCVVIERNNIPERSDNGQ